LAFTFIFALLLHILSISLKHTHTNTRSHSHKGLDLECNRTVFVIFLKSASLYSKGFPLWCKEGLKGSELCPSSGIPNNTKEDKVLKLGLFPSSYMRVGDRRSVASERANRQEVQPVGLDISVGLHRIDVSLSLICKQIQFSNHCFL
jgi:hypothetical protein